MEQKLFTRTTAQLLQEFGAGGHKPGSGSAAALQGLLSAKLILTVIDLTRRTKSSPELPKLLLIESEIKNRIYPELEKLFDLDCNVFHEVINLRRSRKKAPDRNTWWDVELQHQKAMKPATEIPLRIASLCLELGEFAVTVFNEGFPDARGDSGMALNGAICTVSGCVHIMELNLHSIRKDEWTERIRMAIDDLKSRQVNLLEKESLCLEKLRIESHSKLFELEKEFLTSGQWSDVRLSTLKIADLVNHIHEIVWEYQDLIWEKNTRGNFLDLLQPAVVIEKLLGYQFRQYDSLGNNITENGEFRIAGEIDNVEKVVRISRAFTSQEQNFTAAHELGHALLHKGMGLHRDRALDGSVSNRVLTEYEADKFATFFLMPSREVMSIFREIFLTERFCVNQDTVFALDPKNPSLHDFRRKCQTPDALTRILAKAEYYNGKTFVSLSDTFKVSVGAMAIRLKELELFDF